MRDGALVLRGKLCAGVWGIQRNSNALSPAPPAPDVIRGGTQGRLAPARVALGPGFRRDERDNELAMLCLGE